MLGTEPRASCTLSKHCQLTTSQLRDPLFSHSNRIKLKPNGRMSALVPVVHLPEHECKVVGPRPFSLLAHPWQGGSGRGHSTCWDMRPQHSRTLKMVYIGPSGSKGREPDTNCPCHSHTEDISALGQPAEEAGYTHIPPMLFSAGHPHRPRPQCRRQPEFTHTHTSTAILMSHGPGWPTRHLRALI